MNAARVCLFSFGFPTTRFEKNTKGLRGEREPLGEESTPPADIQGALKRSGGDVAVGLEKGL